jgi:hypothetical protein
LIAYAKLKASENKAFSIELVCTTRINGFLFVVNVRLVSVESFMALFPR